MQQFKDTYQKATQIEHLTGFYVVLDFRFHISHLRSLKLLHPMSTNPLVLPVKTLEPVALLTNQQSNAHVRQYSNNDKDLDIRFISLTLTEMKNKQQIICCSSGMI